MKTNYKLTLAVLAGVSIGVAGGKAIQAQQVKAPPAYVIAEIAVTDPNSTDLQKYVKEVPETLAPFNHHYLVRAGKTQASTRTAKHHRRNRVRQRGESARVVRLASL